MGTVKVWSRHQSIGWSVLFVLLLNIYIVIMIARPKPGDSDEDILANQKVFLSEKRTNKDFQPAAKLVGTKKHEMECDNGPQAQKHPRLDIDEKPANTPDDKVYYPVPAASIVGDIVEKNVINSSSLPTTSIAGLQTAKENSNTNSTSIFAQRMKNKRNKNITSNSTLPSGSVAVALKPHTSANVPDCSLVVKGDNAMEIHLQNKSILEGMTEEEILMEKQKLLTTIDPDVLKYIQSLNKKPSPIKNTFKTPNEIVNKIIPENTPSNDFTDNDIVSHPEISNWLHFDTLEKDKLEWIKNMSSVNINSDSKPYEARFDFKGYLLPYTMEYTEETKTLFHHGEEPHRPGYTLNELFQLCRSTITQQRSLALNTIAGLLEYNSLNIYDEIIEIPITKIFFVLRFGIDENIQIILEPALKGLRNMLYHRVDESCLDNMLGIENGVLQPRLLANKIESEETETDVADLKDFHLTDLDLISGALRTDILSRIRYILNSIKPGYLCVEYCLQILIRISRDSIENAEKILQVDGLLQHVFDKYIPKVIVHRGSLKENSENHKLTIDSLKLVRVLACQSKSITEIFLSKYSIFDSIFNYINMTVNSIYLTKIQTEAFYVLSVFVRYDVGSEKIRNITPLVLKTLNDCVNGIDLSSSCSNVFYERAVSLFTLLSNVLLFQNKTVPIVDTNMMNQIDSLLVLSVTKWCYQVSTMEMYSNIKLNLLSSAFICLNTLSKIGFKRDVSSSQLNACIYNMISSKNFIRIADHLSSCSNILSPLRATRNNSNTNISGLCSIILSSTHKLQPTLDNLSPFSFISTLCKFLIINENIDLSSNFLKNDGISSYLLAINLKKQPSFCDSWFSRVELTTLFDLIQLTTKSNCSEIQKTIIYNISFKLSYILTTGFRRKLEFLFTNIIFNKDWFSTDCLLKNLSIDESNEVLNHLNVILECYIFSLKLNKSEFNSTLIISNWNQTILPRDWIYMPILGLYSKFQIIENTNLTNEISKHENMTKNIVCSCLKWILISEMYFPDITNEIHLTDRFCRLICIFLCDNSVFLDSSVKFFLQKCVKIIFDLEKTLPVSSKLNFDRTILGIANFQDLYMQLADQYQAVSYCDPVFAACVLLPLAQKHNIKWRKIVWSEYAGCLRSLDCPEDMLCYPFNEYLNPPETDISLLKCYNTALQGYLLRPGTITYKIAQHHIEAMKARQKCKAVK
ncbi:RNA polymerase II-associated protein 1 [Arctopsyche grandis]|uniref:RNA polymerase II-associated protein 1 n=1 Tax=Arctopsyche grandis TaxID=121162 RepID=UPI00406D9ADA